MAMLLVSILLPFLVAVSEHADKETGTQAPRFDVVWNGPSAGCNGKLTLEDYGISVNANQAFQGEVITMFYKIGVWPTVTATLNATPCWASHVPGCSWRPWSSITAASNGGVPQAANLSLHLTALALDVEASIQDKMFTGLLLIDWEAWRPLAAECYDSMSSYLGYSEQLVRAEPKWAHKSSSEVGNEAARRFNSGAQSFFTATVNAIRKLRPHARIGFYSQGINQAAGSKDNQELLWLWDLVDVLAPSIYPRTENATADAGRNEKVILGALESADMVGRLRQDSGNPRPRPAVFPYARALVDRNGGPMSASVLAAQIQIAAGLGADGVVLWGSSNDYHGGGCEMLETEIKTSAGPTISKCIANRNSCAKQHCSGNGRCTDYDENQLTSTCLSDMPIVKCRCDPGFVGVDCHSSAQKSSFVV